MSRENIDAMGLSNWLGISLIGSGLEGVLLTTSSSNDLRFGGRPTWFTTIPALIRADAV